MSPPELADVATRGRPRDADRTTAILDAAVEVMHDVGWDGFKVQEVATRAGAGLATIYRRWPTKEDLIAAAMRYDADFTLEVDPEAPPTERLRMLLTNLGDKMSRKGGSVISVFAAARDHEAMRQALDDVLHNTVSVTMRDLIREITGAGPEFAVTLADAILGALLFRAGLLEDETPGADFAAEMIGLLDSIRT